MLNLLFWSRQFHYFIITFVFVCESVGHTLFNSIGFDFIAEFANCTIEMTKIEYGAINGAQIGNYHKC